MGSVATVFTIVLGLLDAPATPRRSPRIHRAVAFEGSDGRVAELTEATLVYIKNNHESEPGEFLRPLQLKYFSFFKEISKGEIFSYESTEFQESSECC